MNRERFNEIKQEIIDYLRDGWTLRAIPKKVYPGTYQIKIALRNMDSRLGVLADYYEDIGEIKYT